jgi:hypothetical protein
VIGLVASAEGEHGWHPGPTEDLVAVDAGGGESGAAASASSVVNRMAMAPRVMSGAAGSSVKMTLGRPARVRSSSRRQAWGEAEDGDVQPKSGVLVVDGNADGAYLRDVTRGRGHRSSSCELELASAEPTVGADGRGHHRSRTPVPSSTDTRSPAAAPAGFVTVAARVEVWRWSTTASTKSNPEVPRPE